MTTRYGATVRRLDGLEVHEWAAAQDAPGPGERPDGPDVATDGGARAPVVLLHEGLGSAGLWRGFPAAVATGTRRRVVAISRAGHGRSRPLERPHDPSYMHREAAALGPYLRDALGMDRVVLLGHSDGASIALLHAAEAGPDSVTGLVLLAPHVVVEEETVAGIADARQRYLTEDLPQRMAVHHDDADALFWAWNDVWLSPAFRSWDITDVLGTVTAPALLVQCEDDAYGTLAQLDRIAAGTAGPTERLVLDDGGHSPHLAHPEAVVDSVVRFLADRP